MLPTLEGVIARRVLLNFSVDPDVLSIPGPLEPSLVRGRAVAGICLIRLEHLRPKHFPRSVGVSSENMAHRVAVQWPDREGREEGVYVWRRETDRAFVTALGGRVFPGVHGRATFDVTERYGELHYRVAAADGEADIDLRVREVDTWQPSDLFDDLDDVADFFARGDRGFSSAIRGDRLEGLQLRSLKWEMTPLQVESVRAAFFESLPSGSARLDGAVLMRGIPHEWHELRHVPELAGLDA